MLLKQYFQTHVESEKMCTNLSIGNWVLYKRGSDTDDSYLKFIIEFIKDFFLPHQNIKKYPKKLLIIPLDQQFSVQQISDYKTVSVAQSKNLLD